MSHFTPEFQKPSSYRLGLALLRERFKDAKFRNSYDEMCDAIENMKSELKPKMISKNRQKEVKRIEKIVYWYRTKETRYTRPTEDGLQIIYPPDMAQTVNHNLTIAYELLISELEQLDLL